jgi:hypothetical protein
MREISFIIFKQNSDNIHIEIFQFINSTLLYQEKRAVGFFLQAMMSLQQSFTDEG